jgi:hypothetical protein
MSSSAPVRAVLMSAEIKQGGTGFHKLVFKVDGGRAGMAQVTVMISQDAHRKILQQLHRVRAPQVEKGTLLKVWSRWAIGLRYDAIGLMPSTVTITASDIDDFGGYATELGRVLQLAS